MLWQADAPRGLQIDSVYLPLHLFAQRDTVERLAARRWLAGGTSKRLPSTLAAADPYNIQIERKAEQKNHCCSRMLEAAMRKGNKEDKRQRVGHCSLTKRGGDECLGKSTNGCVTVGLCCEECI